MGPDSGPRRAKWCPPSPADRSQAEASQPSRRESETRIGRREAHRRLLVDVNAGAARRAIEHLDEPAFGIREWRAAIRDRARSNLGRDLLAPGELQMTLIPRVSYTEFLTGALRMARRSEEH